MYAPNNGVSSFPHPIQVSSLKMVLPSIRMDLHSLPCFLSVVQIKYHDKSNIEEKEIILSYGSRYISVGKLR